MSRKASFLSILPALFLFGCSAFDPAATGSAGGGSGALSLRIVVDAKAPFKTIARSGDITVSAPDMTPITAKLTLGDSTVEGRISGIPSGKGRLVELKIYDSAGIARYHGSSAIDIRTDTTAAISIVLTRYTGSAVVTGTVSETDSTLPPKSTPWAPATRVSAGAQGHTSLGSVLDLDSEKAWLSAVANANQEGIDLVFLYYAGAFHLNNAVEAKAAGVANSIIMTIAYDDARIKSVKIVKITAKPADQEEARKVFAAGAPIHGSVIQAGDIFLAESTGGKLALVTVRSVVGTDNKGAADFDLNLLTIP
jgi:hypothetical protein